MNINKHQCQNWRAVVASVPQQCNVELCIMSVCRVVKCDKKRKHRSAGPLLHGGPSGAADDPSVSQFSVSVFLELASYNSEHGASQCCQNKS